MHKTEKMELLRYYEGVLCVCNKDKKAFNWTCVSCIKVNKDTKEGIVLDYACNMHLVAVQVFLGICKGRDNVCTPECEKSL
jgi:hypothetical protein